MEKNTNKSLIENKEVEKDLLELADISTEKQLEELKSKKLKKLNNERGRK